MSKIEPYRRRPILGACFNSIYLGVNILPNHKKKIIEYAKQRNPDIKVYQMKINPNALKLVCEEPT
jgi:hypothetical protein